VTPSESTDTTPRPRVEGERELEILEATLDTLAEVGYDRLTMDAVATRARASKATLYRRWNDKTSLVVDSLLSQKDPVKMPDTGTLRGDLLQSFCGMGGLTDAREVAIFTNVLSALSRDEDFALAFRHHVVGPKIAIAIRVFEQARERGEVADGVDAELLAMAVPGIVLQRLYLFGQAPDADLIARVIDQIIMPAATGREHPTTTPKEKP
jgi:AcrR family transcriptional regulator